jgi:hypothetical protein
MSASLQSFQLLRPKEAGSAMTENHLPAAIQNFIEATNRGDSGAFVAAFTEDAYLNDWGREFLGHEGVRAWNRTDNIGVRSHFELVSAEPGTTPGSYTVILALSHIRW